MSATVPDDWADVVETLRRDLEIVSDDETDEDDASAAIDEVWAIVDEYQDRVGQVDVERIGDVLGVDTDSVDGPIDASSIPRSLVVDDPGRTARLSRLVSLIALDSATDYDVGRLWTDEGDGANVDGSAGEPSAGGKGAASEPASEGSSDESAEEPSGRSSADGASEPDGREDDTDTTGGDEASEIAGAGESPEDGESDEVTEAFRSKLGESLSGLRDRIEAARDDVEGETASGDVDSEDDESEDGGPSSRSRSSRSDEGSSTAVSTVPSDRHDMGGVPRLSTMPGRRGR